MVKNESWRKKMPTQTISLKEELLNEIKIKAEENERSISAEIAYRVKQSLRSEKE